MSFIFIILLAASVASEQVSGSLTAYVHISGGMIRTAYMPYTNSHALLALLMGSIFNVDFLENEIVGFDENLTIAL